MSKSDQMSDREKRAFPPPLINPDEYILEFDGPDDQKHPYNWKTSTKYVEPECSGATQCAYKLPSNLGYSFQYSFAAEHGLSRSTVPFLPLEPKAQVKSLESDWKLEHSVQRYLFLDLRLDQ